ncbi:MAG: ATP-binding protein [Kiritimatiellae bacterium]|nr:ATP-binding protein [Kiritimatiellia bacterium]
MFIKREIDEFLSKRMFSGKVLVVYGPRQAGKTTSIEHYISENGLSSETLIFNGDETVDRDLLADASAEKLKLLIGKKKVVFIDEAQKIPEIGIVLKRFYDKIKDVQVIASGSSSDELAQKTEEPLTGRKFECVLLPLSFSELAGASSPIDEMRLLERRLMFGSYPDVVTHAGDEVSRIREIGKGYLYKDILKYEEIKRPELIDKLLRALAFQIGQEVSFSELAQVVGSDPKTVSKYIDVLEKAFIVFKLGSYSRNLRNELKKSRKVYFYDLGIRNYILGDWRALNLRGSDEVGHIWENYFISERRKYIMAYTPETRMFFWRTQQRQEVDLIEETASGLSAYEVKWNPAKLNKAMSKTFLSAYPQAECHGVSPQNYISYFLK